MSMLTWVRKPSVEACAAWLRFTAIKPANGTSIKPHFAGATKAQIAQAQLWLCSKKSVGRLRLFPKVVCDGSLQELGERRTQASCEAGPLVAQPHSWNRGGVRASKFPLASSVVGSNTASALAAGCPIMFKTRTALHGTSVSVGKAAAGAGSRGCASNRGLLRFVGAGFKVGQTLVACLSGGIDTIGIAHRSLKSKLPISRLDLTLDNLLRSQS